MSATISIELMCIYVYDYFSCGITNLFFVNVMFNWSSNGTKIWWKQGT